MSDEKIIKHWVPQSGKKSVSYPYHTWLDWEFMSFALKCNAMLIQMNTGGHSKLIGKDYPARPVEVWVKEKKTQRKIDWNTGGGWMEWRSALCGIQLGSPGRKLSERAGSPVISLYFHSCQPLLLQMSNSIRSLATYQGIELLWKCTKDKDILERSSNSIGRLAGF